MYAQKLFQFAVKTLYVTVTMCFWVQVTENDGAGYKSFRLVFK